MEGLTILYPADPPPRPLRVRLSRLTCCSDRRGASSICVEIPEVLMYCAFLPSDQWLPKEQTSINQGRTPGESSMCLTPEY